MTYEDDMAAFVRARIEENPGDDVRSKRDAEAKLATVAHYESYLAEERESRATGTKASDVLSGCLTGLEYAVAQFSAIYSDHPDYDPAWIDFGE